MYMELKSNLEEGTKVSTLNWNIACNLEEGTKVSTLNWNIAWNGCNWT